MSIDWTTAPDLAEYWAVDDDGQSHWFETEPRTLSVGIWQQVLLSYRKQPGAQCGTPHTGIDRRFVKIDSRILERLNTYNAPRDLDWCFTLHRRTES